MEVSQTHLRRISVDHIKRALNLCAGTNDIICWAGVSRGVSCTENISGRLDKVGDLLWEICADLQTYDAVKESQGLSELLHRLAVELVCQTSHQNKREDGIFEDVIAALRERLERWDAARSSLRWDENSTGNPQPLQFKQRDDKVHPVHHLLKVMRNSNIGALPGYVYCFSDKSTPGYLKIGFAGSSEVSDEDLSTHGNRHRLFKRLSEQVAKCEFDMRLEFYEHMPCAGLKIESLVHATLHAESWTVVRCKTKKCKTQHMEWFTATTEEVEDYIHFWKRFSNLRPWAESGALLPEWDALAVEHLCTYRDMTVREWIDRYWERVLRDAEIESNPEVQALEARLRLILEELSSVRDEIGRLESAKCRRSKPNEEADADLLRTKWEMNDLESKRGDLETKIKRKRS